MASSNETTSLKPKTNPNYLTPFRPHAYTLTHFTHDVLKVGTDAADAPMQYSNPNRSQGPIHIVDTFYTAVAEKMAWTTADGHLVYKSNLKKLKILRSVPFGYGDEFLAIGSKVNKSHGRWCI